MILNNHNTSIQISKQLPEFIRDDVNYQTFVAFLEAYYEWLQLAHTANSLNTVVNSSGQGITHATQNLLSYVDIDDTMNDFIQYFINDFLPYIPDDALTDKRKLLKISKEFYQSKGTEKSYKFLFRVLYGINAELFETGDVVLKASAGKWIVPKSIRINSTNTNWLLTKGLKIFGETSKSYATIDYALNIGTKTEIYISNIKRQFESGELVKIVDNNNKDVYFYNNEIYIQNQGYEIPQSANTLSQKIVGIISSVAIDPNYKGLFYNTGDPIVSYGGLNPEKDVPIGFIGEVGKTTTGSLNSLIVVNPSNGYRLPPNTNIIISGDGTGAAAQVSLLDDTKQTVVTLVTSNTLGAMANVNIGNSTIAQTYYNFAVSANTNSTLANTLTFKSYVVAPIASVELLSRGLNYSVTPSVLAQSLYTTDYGTDDFSYLGILQPIQIVNGGTGYGNSNTISIVGGTGFGAYANVTVNTTGSIISANYIYSSSNTIQTYPLGGLGYTSTALPTVQITSTSGTNASLVIPGILAEGATFSPTSDKIGSISSINIINAGEDYVATPNLSLRVADVAVSNVSLIYPIQSGDLIFQGSSLSTKTYYASVDSFEKVITASPPNTANDTYQIRIYNYVGAYNSSLPLKIVRTVNATTDYTLVMYPQNYYTDIFGNPSTIKNYGDGSAKASASFLGGLITGEGKYLNDDGQLSSLGIVLQSLDYNNFTYILSTSKALATYKDLILNLVHPSGTRLIGRNLINTSNNIIMAITDDFQTGVSLEYVAGSAAYATLSVNNTTTNISNNIIKFTNVISGNIGNTIFANDIIEFTATNNIRAYSTITRVDWSNNQVYMQDNVFLTFANVAIGSINTSSNVININTLTGEFDGNFGILGPLTPIGTIVSVGDTVSFNGGTYYTVTKFFANGNFSINNSAVGPLDNVYITVNKNANTQSVMIYGDVGLYEYPQITTELGDSLLTEAGDYLLIG
jgi:hypothetical protein